MMSTVNIMLNQTFSVIQTTSLIFNFRDGLKKWRRAAVFIFNRGTKKRLVD